MASADEKLFEDEKFVIISSTREIDMRQWRNHLIENWETVEVFFKIENSSRTGIEQKYWSNISLQLPLMLSL